TGTVGFTDVDLIDVHLATETNLTGTLGGTLTLGAVSEDATSTDGSVAWNYTVANSASQFLVVGETATETFSVKIDDQHGSTATQTVTVTATGVNDPVSIVAGTTDASGAVTEDTSSPNLTDTGTVGFTDVDLIDAHLATQTPLTGTLGGTLTLGTVSEDATSTDGSVAWTYTVANANTQYLAVGETATETFSVKIDDQHGSTATQTVTVVATGVNDPVSIVAGTTDASGAVTEDTSSPNLTDTGTVGFTD